MYSTLALGVMVNMHVHVHCTCVYYIHVHVHTTSFLDYTIIHVYVMYMLHAVSHRALHDVNCCLTSLF